MSKLTQALSLAELFVRTLSSEAKRSNDTALAHEANAIADAFQQRREALMRLADAKPKKGAK